MFFKYPELRETFESWETINVHIVQIEIKQEI